MEHLATSFVRLVNAAPSSFVLFIVMFLLTLDLKLKSVVDLSIVYQTDKDDNLALKYAGSLIGKDSLLYKLAGISNIFSFARTSSLAITIVLVLILLGVFLWLAWWCFVPKTNLSFTAGEGESEKKIPLQTTVASFILHYFEYFFLLSITIFTQSVTCFSVSKENSRYTNQNTLVTMPNKQALELETYNEESSYNDLNTSITCKSITHIYLVIFTSILVLLAIIFKVVNHRLLSYRPNPEFLLSKFGASDNAHTILIVGLLILKTIIKSIPNQLSTSLVFYFAIGGVLGAVDLVIQTVTYPFYNKSVNRFRYIETLLISLVCFHVVVTMSIDSTYTHNEVYLILSICLSLIVTLRVADNTGLLIYDQSLLDRRKDVNNRKVLSFVYMGIKYINACLLNDLKAVNSIEYQKIIFYFMTENQNDLRRSVTHQKWSLAKGYTSKSKVIAEEAKSHASSKEKTPAKNSANGRIKSLKFSEASRDPKSNKIELAKSLATDSMDRTEKVEEKRVKVTKLSRNTTDASPEDTSKFSIAKSKSPINNISDVHGNRISINGVPINNQAERAVDKIEKNFERPLSMFNKTSVNHFQDMIAEANNIKVENEERMLNGMGLGYSLTTFSTDERAKRDATFALFDSFSESKSHSVRVAVKMLDDMIEDHMYTLMNTPGVELRTMFVLLNTYVYFKLNYLGGAYQVSIRVREIERKFANMNNGMNHFQTRMSFQLLYATIKSHIKNNLETGNLIMPHMRNFMSFDQDQKNTVKLYDVTQFINIYNDIKLLMKAMVVNKSKFLQGLLNNGADFKVISQQANLFTNQKQKIQTLFKVMIRKSKGKFTPLMMIYGTYLFYIEQNIELARRVLRQFIAKKFYFDLRSISDMSMAKDQEMMTIGCSMEKDSFHKINMVSCNVYYHLEYDAFELIGQDLNILVPKPLSDYHRDLMLPQNLTGVLFERKTLTETPIRKKNGFMTTCKASFRMNYRINECLEVFAVLVFEKENQNLKNLIVVDETMMITEISEVCTDHFEKGTFIYQYNKKFFQIFEDLNYVSHFRLKHGNIELKQLMKDNNILERYYTYFRFLNGEDIEIKDKTGTRRFINIKIIVNYMPSVQKFIRFVEYDLLKEEEVKQRKINTDLIDEEISDQLDFSYYDTNAQTGSKRIKYDYSKLDQAEIKVKHLLDYLHSCTLIQGASKTLMSSERDLFIRPSDKNGSQKTVSKEKNSIFNLKTIKPSSKSQSDMTMKNNSLLTSRQTLFSVHSEHKTTGAQLSALSYDSPVKGQHFNTGTDTNHAQNGDDDSSKRRNFETSGVDKKKMSENSKRRSTSYRRIVARDSKVHEYMAILHGKIRTLKSNVMFIILIIYLLVSLVFQALIGSEKYIIQKLVSTDVLTHLSAVDDITVALNAALKTLDVIDMNRNVFTGVIPNDLLAEFGIADLVAQNAKSDDTLQFRMQNSINVANKKMTEAEYYDKRYTPKFLYSPHVKGSMYNNSAKKWQTIDITFRSLGSLLQPMIDIYSARDAATAKSIGPSQNPQGDILEQTLRKNLGGEETKVIYELVLLASQYFKYIAEYNKSFLLTSELLAIFSIFFVSIIVLLYALLLRLKMKSVFLTIFQFRVGLDLSS